MNTIQANQFVIDFVDEPPIYALMYIILAIYFDVKISIFKQHYSNILLMFVQWFLDMYFSNYNNKQIIFNLHFHFHKLVIAF